MAATKSKSSDSIIISGQQIPWSFVQRIANFVDRDWDRVMDIFWKSRDAKNIMRYIQKGLIPNAEGKRYILYPSRERDNGKIESIRQWWHQNVYVPKRKAQPDSVADIFRMIANGLDAQSPRRGAA